MAEQGGSPWRVPEDQVDIGQGGIPAHNESRAKRHPALRCTACGEVGYVVDDPVVGMGCNACGEAFGTPRNV